MSTNLELIEQYDNDIDQKQKKYYNRSVLKKEIRSYEVSLWTLQDDFMTVLKWSDAEQKGRIENPKMMLNVDGTQKLTFSIPMAYRHEGKLIDNPNWYNVENGNLIQGLRKIKVIFNKNNEQTTTIITKPLVVSTNYARYIPNGYYGNVDLSNRKIVPRQKFIDSGYESFSGDYGTIYSMGFTESINGDYYLFTPVLLDGSVLSVADLRSYFNDLQARAAQEHTTIEQIDADTSKLFLAKFMVSTYGTAAAAQTAGGDWAENLHMLQEKWDYVRYLHFWFNDSTVDPYHSYPGIGPDDFVAEIEAASVAQQTTTTTKIRDNVFEFVITNITEGHEGDIKTCNITAEGLAFQELGKIGYKLNLSQENFELTYQQWQELGYWFDRTTVRSVEAAKHIKVSSLPSSNIKDGYLYLVPAEQNKLSAYMYINDAWEKVGSANTYEPAQTLDYWCQEGCNLEQFNGNVDIGGVESPRVWYYTVQLNQNSFEDNRGRSSGKIYEESYAVDWDNNMKPTTMMPYREMARAMSIENSNLYNITQELAEKFHVFCRYKYLYDDNYHITGRIIIFYNNYMQEDKGNLVFTYPYSASRTERSIDSADVTTKMYVLSVDNNAILAGESSIIDAEPNYSQEDYILNFDYLIQTQGAPEDTNTYVKNYLKQMRTLNKELKILQYQLATYQTQLPELEAKKSIYKKSLDLDDETILAKQQLHDSIASVNRNPESGYFEKVGANCDQAIIQTKEDGSQYINLSTTNLGIVESTLKIYRTFSSTLSNPINDYITERDDNNNVISIKLLTPIDTSNSTLVYLEYSYDPQLYYQNIIKTWQAKRADDEKNYNDVTKEIGPKTVDEEGYDLDPYPSGTTIEDAYYQGLHYKIDHLTSEVDTKLNEKKALIAAFERYLGPAIREGYWQPEDYNDYGERLDYTSVITKDDITVDVKKEAIIAWDSLLFDGEDSLHYYIGVDKRIEFYPCINLHKIFLHGIPTDLDSYSLVWKSSVIGGSDSWEVNKNLTVFGVGSKALIKFIKVYDTYTPVLMLEGAKTFTIEQLEKLMVSGQARLEKYSTYVDGAGEVHVSHGTASTRYTIPANAWICYTRYSEKPENWSSDLWNRYTHEYSSENGHSKLVYPRIKFSSLMLKTDTSNFSIKYGDQLLELGADYYINTRNTLRNNVYYPEYYITIQPRSLIKYEYDPYKPITVYYALSNACTDIYLDALKISEENAKPKVSYNVSINVLDTSLINQLYGQLARIVMITDTDLKFENVFGYISNLDLDLDKPWQDQVEIKNYTTKFEDLFSSIVAQSEEMKRNEGMMSAMLAGTSPLSEEGLAMTLSNEQIVMQSYLDSYFDSSQVVQNRLADLFTEASEVLTSSSQALNKVHALTLQNAGILQGFARNVQEELTPEVIRSTTRPQRFKVGDIWIKVDGTGHEIARYIAVANSSDVSGNTTGHDGFVRTSDGTLASITGAALDIDTENGIINLKAQNSISLKSGNELYMAAQDAITMICDRNDGEINIAGTTINLCSLHKREIDPITGQLTELSGDQNLVSTNGINLIAGEYGDIGNSEVSKILINPHKIQIGAAELELASASQLNLISSTDPPGGDTNHTSAIHISADDGIWIGTGTQNGLHLFGGNGGIQIDANGKVIPGQNGTDIEGASVELNSEHLILGFANINNDAATAVELTEQHVIIAAGGRLDRKAWEANKAYTSGDIVVRNNDYYKCITSHTSDSSWDATKWKALEVDGTTTGLVGARFTSDKIGLATESSGIVNAVIMNSNGVTIGSGVTGFTDGKTLATATKEELRALAPSNGSYVRISGEGIEVGSFADVYINTDNIKLQTHSRDTNNQDFVEGETVFALGSNLQQIGYTTQYNPSTNTFQNYDKVNHQYTDLTAVPTVRLLVNKNGAYVNGNVYATSFIAQCTNGYFKATGTSLGFYKPEGGAFLTLTNNELTCTGPLYISAENLRLGLNSNAPSLSSTMTDMLNNEVVETVRLYKIHTSNDSNNPPSIANENDESGTYKNSSGWYKAADTTWTSTIPEVTTTKKYLWSITRRMKANATYKYYYSDRKYESYLGNDYKETYLQYTRAAKNIAEQSNPANDPNNFTWSDREIPHNTTTTNASGNVLYAISSSAESDVWCRVCTVTSREKTYGQAFKDEQLSELSEQAIKALNIASGYIAVPHVYTTGIEITKTAQGKGQVNILSTGEINIAANGAINITNSAGNDALILDQHGIVMATSQKIAFAAGSEISMIVRSYFDANNNIIAATDNNTAKNYYLDTSLIMDYTGLVMNTAKTTLSDNITKSGKFTLDYNALQYYINNNPALIVNGNGLYLSLVENVPIAGSQTNATHDSKSVFHVKVEDELSGLFYRTQNFVEQENITTHVREVHTYDTHTYITGSDFSVTTRDTNMNGVSPNKTGSIVQLRITNKEFSFYEGAEIVRTDTSDWNENITFDRLTPVVTFRPDGGIIKELAVGSITVNNNSQIVKPNLVISGAWEGLIDNSNNTDPYCGYTIRYNEYNTTETRTTKKTFWIDMPPHSQNNNTDQRVPAFWYLDGTVYIRNLVYYTMSQSNEAFGVTSGGSSSSGGTSSGTTSCSDCDGSCYYGCYGGCDRTCDGTCASGCQRTCTGRCTGSGGGCFVAGTLINLFNGSTIAIEKLTLGTKVESYNPETQQYEEAEIVEIKAYLHRSYIVDIYFTSGEYFTATQSHPILTTKGWKSLDPIMTYEETKMKVELLQIGDEVVTKEQQHVYVDKIVNREDLNDSTVYNCAVVPNNTYIVNDIVVHNAKEAGS